MGYHVLIWSLPVWPCDIFLLFGVCFRVVTCLLSAINCDTFTRFSIDPSSLLNSHIFWWGPHLTEHVYDTGRHSSGSQEDMGSSLLLSDRRRAIGLEMSIGQMPYFSKPLHTLTGPLSWSLVCSCNRRLGTCDFGMVLYLRPNCSFHPSRIFRQVLFMGRTKATSRGCNMKMCGWRQTNLIFCFSASTRTLWLKWLGKLSPMRTIGPDKWRTFGKKWLSNQSLKQVASNQPFWDLLYLAPLGPPEIQLCQRPSALCTIYGAICHLLLRHST